MAYTPGRTWNPLAVNQMMSGGEGMEFPRFYNDPGNITPERNEQGDWGYWSINQPELSNDWIHGDSNPWQAGIDQSSQYADMYLPSFWNKAVRSVTSNFDPAKGLFDIPTSYGSEQEMLSNPMWWGLQDLNPQVRQEVIKDPRAAYASLMGVYNSDPNQQFNIPEGYEALRSMRNKENYFPTIGAEGGYRSMQDLQWLPGYGLIAPTDSFIPQNNEPWQMLVPFGVGALGAMVAAPALVGAAGTASAAGGTGAATGELSAEAVGADSLAGMTGEGTLSGGSQGANMFDIFDLNLTGDMANALASGGEAPLGLGEIGIGSAAADFGAGLSSSAAGSLPWYEQLYNAYKSPLGQTLGKLGSAGYQQLMAGKNQNNLNDLINQYRNQSDPFGAQRPGYQQLLEQSYRNPEQLYQSPEYQALGKLYTEQIARRDASKGRTVSGTLPRTIELQDHFMKWLSDYRQGLQNPAGTTINPNGLLGNLAGLYNTGQNQYYNALGAIPNAVSSLFDSYANEKEGWLEKLGSMFSSNSNNVY